MNNDLNKLDDLFDENINKALKKLGLITPQTAKDFRDLDNEISRKSSIQPEKLKDPLAFLDRGERKRGVNLNEMATDTNADYSSVLAQAAREGKTISEEVKKQMQEDKRQSFNKKKE
jgi:hypothetical protein